jgi:hypothetical protein
VSALITALCLWLAGHGLIAAVSRGARRRPRRPLELHATALLAGTAALALAAFYAVAWLGPLAPRAGFGLLLAAAVPGALAVGRAHAAAMAARGTVPRWSGLERLAGALIAAFALFAVFAAASVPTHGFDATFHYAYKAKLLFHEGFATEAWTDLGGPIGRSMEHPTYPPLVPALELLVAWTRAATTGGGFDDDAARPLMAVFALAPLALLVTALAGRGRGVALLAGLAWITTPLLYYWRLPHQDRWLGWLGLFLGPEAAAARFGTSQPWSRPPNWCLDGTADLPLAAFAFAAFLHATRLARGKGDRLDALAAGLCAAAALTAKNEGAALVSVLALALAAGALLTPRASRAPGAVRGLLAAALVAILASAGWFFARAGLPNVDENYPARLTPGAIADSLGRARDVAARFAHTLFDVTMWNLTWPLLAAAALWAIATRRVAWNSPPCTALLVIAGATLAYALVLLVTPWDLALLETTGIPMRLLLHVAPLAVFATFALAFAPREEADPGLRPTSDTTARPNPVLSGSGQAPKGTAGGPSQ